MTRTISVVTINRNDAAGLARTVRSFACLRAEPGIEFVFVDGASQDSSLDVARSFYRPEEIVSEPDRGIYDAMNKGLRRSTGDYVVWINSGDEFSGNMSVIEAVKQASCDVISFCAHVIYASDSSRNFVWRPGPESMPKSTLPHAATYFKRSTAVSLGGYQEKWRVVADRELIVRHFLSGASFCYHSDEAAIFHSGGVSSAVEVHYLEAIRLNYELGLIGLWGLVGRYAKYHLILHPRTKAGARLLT